MKEGEHYQGEKTVNYISFVYINLLFLHVILQQIHVHVPTHTS